MDIVEISHGTREFELRGPYQEAVRTHLAHVAEAPLLHTIVEGVAADMLIDAAPESPQFRRLQVLVELAMHDLINTGFIDVLPPDEPSGPKDEIILHRYKLTQPSGPVYHWIPPAE